MRETINDRRERRRQDWYDDRSWLDTTRATALRMWKIDYEPVGITWEDFLIGHLSEVHLHGITDDDLERWAAQDKEAE